LYRKSKNTFYIQYFFSENLAVYEAMWKNILEPDRLQMTHKTTQKRCDFHAR